ncbi:thermonuclease family protein [Aquabacterium sp. A08]|uniref:thermonuclease family protein n=1 Tax=Aquabacterium sp. A08 TaxID=2718532 RepID=UPI00141ED05C|nr:thermonuclease family protein [Aquabacterium sp. A08]NIC40113.1 nuclease [Aquabacterium sp. A08]
MKRGWTGRTRALFAAFLIGWALAATVRVQAAEAVWLTGRVVAVVDGDTVQVYDGTQRHTVRLAAIDAPERRQAHSQRARQQLAAWVAQREVLVTHRRTDRYRRLVGQVWLDGEDVGLRLVRAGLAWHATPYQREQDPADRQAYAAAQAQARAERLGLWSDEAPQPPWLFRRQPRMAPP